MYGVGIMTLLQVSAAFGFAFKSFGSFFSFDKKGSEQRKHYLFMGLGALILCGGFFMLYRWYVVSREQSVQKIFSQQVLAFDRAKTPDELEAMALEFKASHDANAGSHLAPYFTAYEVDALLKLDKKTEALAALDALIASLSSSNPLINLYKTKRALLKFDMDDANLQESGLKELQQLTQDKKNHERDMAQFYLGLYYYGAENVAEAKKVWQELVEQFIDVKKSSPWAQQAAQKLDALA